MVDKLDKGAEWTCICRPYGIINGFSCFGVQDSYIKKVGYFDETISPNYAYFEDNDAAYRMKLAGVIGVDSEAEAVHDTSSTLKAFTPEQTAMHHIKFNLAQNNYIKKWGGLPLHETYRTPYNA
jgi:GT2 family glycosyltransferase